MQHVIFAELPSLSNVEQRKFHVIPDPGFECLYVNEIGHIYFSGGGCL